MGSSEDEDDEDDGDEEEEEEEEDLKPRRHKGGNADAGARKPKGNVEGQNGRAKRASVRRVPSVSLLLSALGLDGRL